MACLSRSTKNINKGQILVELILVCSAAFLLIFFLMIEVIQQAQRSLNAEAVTQKANRTTQHSTKMDFR